MKEGTGAVQGSEPAWMSTCMPWRIRHLEGYVNKPGAAVDFIILL